MLSDVIVSQWAVSVGEPVVRLQLLDQAGWHVSDRMYNVLLEEEENAAGIFLLYPDIQKRLTLISDG